MPAFIVNAVNRRDLVNSVDVVLLTSGTRVTKGTYEVTIKRLSKKELAELAREEAEQARQEAEAKKCASWGHVRDAKGLCSRCGEQT